MINKRWMTLVVLLAAGGAYALDAPFWIGIKDPAWNEMYPTRVQAMQTKGDAVHGEAKFVVCQGCHHAAAAGEVDGSYSSLAGQHVSVLIKQMTDIQTERRYDPRMQSLVYLHEVLPQHVADIAAYLHGLPATVNHGKGPGDKLQHGKSLYMHDCASCHGSKGEGSDEKYYPRVSGQHFKFLERESLTIRNGKRRNAHPDMVHAIKHYTDEDIAAVADYMSRLPVKP
jgi:cytochrome c553